MNFAHTNRLCQFATLFALFLMILPAVAQEQEMKAQVVEMSARVVEAEAQVPLAMAEAFRSGNLGIMDYYKMKNVAADTKMREQISKGETDGAQTGKNT